MCASSQVPRHRASHGLVADSVGGITLRGIGGAFLTHCAVLRLAAGEMRGPPLGLDALAA
jgi:hypothetical protein